MPSLPDIKRVKAKGRTYLYFRTGQKDGRGREILARLPDMKDPGFATSYASFRAAKTRRSQAEELTVSGLIDLYQKGAHFKSRAPSTQRLYGMYLKQLRDLLGEAPADLVEARDIARMIDSKADTPGAANSLLRAINALWKWGRKRHHVTNDPGREVDELEIGEWEPWPETVLERMLKSESAEVRLATHILYFTALRFNDALALRWSDIRDSFIYVTPRKTRKTRGEMVIPIHRDLAAELARTPRRGLTVLTTEAGLPIHENGLRLRIQAEARKFGVEIVPHGLRKNAVNALLECGCSAAETAAISGQSLAMVEHYAKRRNQTKLASAAVLRWEGNR